MVGLQSLQSVCHGREWFLIPVAQPTSTNTAAGTDASFTVGDGTRSRLPINGKGCQWDLLPTNNGATLPGYDQQSHHHCGELLLGWFPKLSAWSSPTPGLVSERGAPNLFSTDTDVTGPSDTITAFGGKLFGDDCVSLCSLINDLGTKFGAGVSGPGLVYPATISPTSLPPRIYTANDVPERDPSITSGRFSQWWRYLHADCLTTLALPDGRNTATATPDPMAQFVQEVHFPNTSGYITYRLTFCIYKRRLWRGSMQVGEIELLGRHQHSQRHAPTPRPWEALLTINASVVWKPTPTSRWRNKSPGSSPD